VLFDRQIGARDGAVLAASAPIAKAGEFAKERQLCCDVDDHEIALFISHEHGSKVLRRTSVGSSRS
jgi:hypothetical protein